MKLFLVAALYGFALVPIAAQSQYQAPLGRSSGSSVKIASIEPPTANRLKDGETVKIAAEVEYVLAAPKGMLGVFVQNDEGRSLLVRSTCPPISAGKGRVTVSADVRVKDADAVHFIVALYHEDSGSSGVTATRVYVVSKK
jgi:hypothetical protein